MCPMCLCVSKKYLCVIYQKQNAANVAKSMIFFNPHVNFLKNSRFRA